MSYLIYVYTIYLFTIFSLLFLGTYVLFRGRKSITNIVFSIFIYSTMTWVLANYFADTSKIYEYALFWSKFAIVGATLTPAFFLHFTYLFPVKREIKKYLYFVFYLPPLIFTLLFPYKINIEDVSIKEWGVEITAGALYNYLSFYLVFFLVWAFINLIINYRNCKGKERMQAFYILIGAVISFSIAIFTNLFLVLLGNSRYTSFGFFAGFVFVLFCVYTITRYRFMGVRVIMSKIYLYAVLGFFAYIFFYATYLFETIFLGGVFSVESLSFGFFIGLIFAYIFLKTLNYTQKVSDIIFFKGYNPKRILKDIILKITTVINFSELLDTLAFEFKKIFGTEKMDVLLFPKNDKEKKICVKGLRDFTKFELCIEDLIYQRIAESNNIIIRDELKDGDQEIIDKFDKYNIKIIAPLIARYRLIGVIILGEKTNHDAYTQEDIEFLEIIISQTATAIENARLYKEVDEFSHELKKRVDEQTADIREKTERLQKLLAMRSEFLDIASHQLRTPVSVIKGVLSMMKEGSVPDDRKDEFIESALVKSFKLEEVIDEILRASEMDSDKFEIDMEPFDLLDLLKDIYEDKKVLAEESGLKLKFNLPKKLPLVLSNEKYIKHAIRNLINNSIQYTKKGSITLSLAKNNDYVEIQVKDTGIGIPKKDLPDLFKKFSRAKNAVDAYTDGSGLGLFIIKKIMDSHPGGRVYIKKTELNKGTTMVLKLPIAKEKK